MRGKLHLEWELPEEALDRTFQEELLKVVKEETALRLFREGKVTSGFAAKLLGRTRREFLALLKARGIPFVRYTKEDLKADRKALERAETASVRQTGRRA